MNEKMRSSVMGLILGQFSSPLPEAQKEPVAYLYNGVRLPKLPEWDKTVYPYAYMNKNFLFNRYYFTALSGVEYFADSDGYWSIENHHKQLMCYYYSKSGEFCEWYETESGDETVGIRLANIGWANFNVLNEDGTLYLAASEPIPVYE